MASAARNVIDVRRSVTSDSLSLSAVEKTALEFCKAKAAKGEQITRAEIAIAIGSQNLWGGTAPGVLNRLEAKGKITRTFFQRGVQVCIPETGQCTAPPACQAPHWRHREQPVQTPPLHALKQRDHKLTFIIEREASIAGLHIQDFLMDLVANGLDVWLAKREEEEGLVE